jgi:hypothetical protein
VVTPFSMLFGCAQGIASIFWWAKLDQSVSLGETYSQVKQLMASTSCPLLFTAAVPGGAYGPSTTFKS